MKIMVTGSTGLVGSQVVKDLVKEKHEVYSCYHNEKPEDGIPIQLDLLNQNKIRQTIQEIKPDRIIHLGAVTDVELCEIKKDLAVTVNSEATKTIAKQAAKQKIFFVYVSTDYVFDGIVGMKKEKDFTNPSGFYGKTKLDGELALNNISSGYCIVRTSTPFGIHNKKESFPLWVKKNLELKKEISVLVDQFTSPTYVPNLSKMIIEVALRQITGIIHLAGATRISRYEFAKIIADKLNLDKTSLKPITLDKINWNAKRPKDSSLDVSLATEILNEKPQGILQSIRLFSLEV